MKFSTNAILSLGLLFTLAFSSCKKDEDTDTTTPDSGTSFISIVNASPSLATYNFYMDNVKMNDKGALPLGGTIPYAQVKSATYASKFTSASSTESLLAKSLTLSSSGVYTYFLTGQSGSLEGIMIKDEIAGVTTQAAIRLVNMSPDAAAFDLVVKAGAPPVVTNQFYKSVSAFVALEPAKYTLNVVDKTGKVIATLPDVTIAAGKYYSVLVRGMQNPGNTDHPLAAQLIVNL